MARTIAQRNEVLAKAKADPAWHDLTPDAQERLKTAILEDRWPNLFPLA